METSDLRSAWLGAGIALVLTLLAVLLSGGAPAPAPGGNPAAVGLEAPTPTLDSAVRPVPAAPQQAADGQ